MKKFKPRKGQTYYMINSRWDVKETFNTGSIKSRDRIAVGNCFKTFGEAYDFAYQIRHASFNQKRPWWRIF